jgi:hypothetical protein
MAHAQGAPVGTVADVIGKVEVLRAGQWEPLGAGGTVAVTEKVRTGKPGRVRVVFPESVLVLGDETQVEVKEYPSVEGASKPQALFVLIKGKLRALVSKWFSQSGGSYEVETTTASVGVRGTEFAAVYDPVADVTQVVGVAQTTRVYAAIDRGRKRGVELLERDLTVVERGKYPTAPRKLEEMMFRQYLEGLEFLGSGESQASTHALATGSAVPPADGAEALAATGVPGSLSPGGVLVGGQFPHPMAPMEGGLVPTGQVEPVTSQPPASVNANSKGNLGVDF